MLSKNARSSRREFVSSYNPITTRVVKLVARGWESSRIASKVGIPVGTVAAVKANLTRGSYAPYAKVNSRGKVVGVCQF